MNTRILIAILIATTIISVSLVVSAFGIGIHSRYELGVSSDSSYKLDRKTGRVWWIRGVTMYEVKEE